VKLSHIIIQSGLFIGFFSTWIGFFCFFFSVAGPNLSLRRILENISLPYAERIERLNDDFVQGGKSRLGRAGQFFIAIGLTALILTGIIWLALRIIERQGMSG